MTYRNLEALGLFAAVFVAVSTYIWVGTAQTVELNSLVAATGMLGTAGLLKIITAKGTV